MEKNPHRRKLTNISRLRRFSRNADRLFLFSKKSRFCFAFAAGFAVQCITSPNISRILRPGRLYSLIVKKSCIICIYYFDPSNLPFNKSVILVFNSTSWLLIDCSRPSVLSCRVLNFCTSVSCCFSMC